MDEGEACVRIEGGWIEESARKRARGKKGKEVGGWETAGRKDNNY